MSRAAVASMLALEAASERYVIGSDVFATVTGPDAALHAESMTKSAKTATRDDNMRASHSVLVEKQPTPGIYPLCLRFSLMRCFPGICGASRDGNTQADRPHPSRNRTPRRG
ncbi:MAG: hypothetical protein WBO09_23000 [Methylocystis silviterrae]